MSNNQDYQSMNLQTLLLKLGSGHALLPVFQREYVWNKEDIESLFESIADGYPIGTFIFWEIDSTKISTYIKGTLLYFLKESKRKRTRSSKNTELQVNDKFSRVNPNDKDSYTIVLDGQQRLTSLYIAFYGKISYLKAYGNINKPSDWTEERLYYNLEFVPNDPTSKRFQFLDNEKAKEGSYVLVGDILDIKYKNTYDLISDIVSRYPSINQRTKTELAVLWDKCANNNINLISYFNIPSNSSFDDAIDIFVRINSTGKKLTTAELAEATITGTWQEGSEKIRKLVKEMTGVQFTIDNEYILRFFLMIVNRKSAFKLSMIDLKFIERLKKEWQRIVKVFKKLQDILEELQLSDKNISSKNAFLPVLYYLYKGGKIAKINDYNEVRKYLTVASCQGIFSGQSNNVLDKLIEKIDKLDLKKDKFSANHFKRINLGAGKSFDITITDIEHWLSSYKKGDSRTYSILCVLYPEYDSKKYKLDQDHCHPRSAFETDNIKGLKLSVQEEEIWREKCDLIPNLQLLTDKENRGEGKKDQPLKEWYLDDKRNHIVRYYEIKDINGLSDLDLTNFETFYNERRQKMLEQLQKSFGI